MSISVTTQYIWIAVYDDETQLAEYEQLDSGEVKQHYWADIQLERCVAFVLQAVGPHVRDVTVKFSPNKKLIFFRRYPTEFNFQEQTITPLDPVHVIGWQHTVKRKNISVYLYIFSDGSSLLSDDFKAV